MSVRARVRVDFSFDLSQKKKPESDSEKHQLVMRGCRVCISWTNLQLVQFLLVFFFCLP